MPPALIAALIGLGSNIIGNLFGMNAANQAESGATQAADRMRADAERALAAVNNNAAAKTLTKSAVSQLGGAMGSTGLLGSSMADNAYNAAIGDIIGRLAPAQNAAMMDAYRMMMAPEQGLMNFYAGGAQGAANSSGMDLSWLAQLLPMLTGGSSYSGGGSFTSPNAVAGSDYKFR